MPTHAQLKEWLLAATTIEDPIALFDQLATRLSQAGLPVERASASLMTKHPEVFGRQLIWMRGKGAHAVERSHEYIESTLYQNTPVAQVRRTREKVRVRLERPAGELEYPVLGELKQLGLTDYVAFPMLFRSGLVSFVSWATERPGGFRDDELEVLEQIVPALSLRWELECTNYALAMLLSTYLGGNAAARVLGGEFKRRTGSRLEAVIWSCDLRGFTGFVDREPIDEVLRTLDEYFSCVAAPVGAQGGEVLKFIGDAVLAVFPIAGDAREACARSLRAADAACQAAEAVNRARQERGADPIRFGLGLHVGEVVYGNIGVEGRLDFTVIGRAVNEVSRVESLTKELARSVLLTSAFVAASGTERAVSVGTHAMRGVSEPIELFALTP